MIKRTKQGYQVRSEDGKKALSKPDLTKEEAEKRLRQIEHYKRAKKK